LPTIFAGAPNQASEGNVLRQRCDARGLKRSTIEIIARRMVAPAFAGKGAEERPPPPSDASWWGGMRFANDICRGPKSSVSRRMCCDSVAMRAVSSRCQLKSLRDERWRRPLRHREIDERAAPRTKRGHHTRLEWAPPRPWTRHGGGGSAACQQYLPEPQIKRQKAMCCDSVAMRAV
jgi:hypothetical protein